MSKVYPVLINLSYIVSFGFRLDDGQANGGDDQYDGDYDKEQQKNDIHLAEGEDEGEGNLRTIESIRPRN